MDRSCGQNGRRYECFHNLTGKPTGKRSLGKYRRKWEEDIRIYLKEIGVNTRNWVDSAQDRNY